MFYFVTAKISRDFHCVCYCYVSSTLNLLFLCLEVCLKKLFKHRLFQESPLFPYRGGFHRLGLLHLPALMNLMSFIVLCFLLLLYLF